MGRVDCDHRVPRASRRRAVNHRLMPFFVTVLTFLAVILLLQEPIQNDLSLPKELAEHPGFLPFPRPPGAEPLTSELLTGFDHPTPRTDLLRICVTGRSVCLRPIAALIWKDYEEWTPRIMPYALLQPPHSWRSTCHGRSLGLRDEGWHGFWAWDPVENAPFSVACDHSARSWAGSSEGSRRHGERLPVPRSAGFWLFCRKHSDPIRRAGRQERDGGARSRSMPSTTSPRAA